MLSLLSFDTLKELSPEVDYQIIHAANKFLWNVEGGDNEEAVSEPSNREKPIVLVVDDEQLIADTVTEILNLYGFRASAAYGGKSALDIAEKIQPDYLLTDVLMPFMNGIELAISIKNLFPVTRIVLFSGQAGISDILQQGREQGHEFELIAKPIHPEKLVAILKKK